MVLEDQLDAGGETKKRPRALNSKATLVGDIYLYIFLSGVESKNHRTTVKYCLSTFGWTLAGNYICLYERFEVEAIEPH